MAKAGPGITIQVAKILEKHGLVDGQLHDIKRIELTVDSVEGVQLVIHKFADPDSLLGAFTTFTDHFGVKEVTDDGEDKRTE